MTNDYAILNYYEKSKIHPNEIKVYESDYVTAKDDEFDLTIGLKYQIIEVNNFDMITIKNDKNIVDVYSVENFYSNIVHDKYERRIVDY